MRFFRPRGFLDVAKIKRLYREAFPRCERKPFSIIISMAKNGKSDLWYFEDESGFAGFCATINGNDKILIDYLAVDKKRRGTGIGSEMLKELLEYYKDYGVFLEIEMIDENNVTSIRRREFYLRAGFLPMDTYADVFGVNMEILGSRCTLTFDEYREFYRINYGEFAYNHIKAVGDNK